MDQKGRLVLYSVIRVKQYTMEEDTLNIIYDNSGEAGNALKGQSSNSETNDNDPNDIWMIPDPLNVFIVKIIQSYDRRVAHKNFQEAKKIEGDGLVSKNICHKVSLRSILNNTSSVSGRSPLTLENADTSDKSPKVLYVA